VRFTPERPLSKALVHEIVAARLIEIGAAEPQ